MKLQTPKSTRTEKPVPYTTIFRYDKKENVAPIRKEEHVRQHRRTEAQDSQRHVFGAHASCPARKVGFTQLPRDGKAWDRRLTATQEGNHRRPFFFIGPARQVGVTQGHDRLLRYRVPPERRPKPIATPTD